MNASLPSSSSPLSARRRLSALAHHDRCCLRWRARTRCARPMPQCSGAFRAACRYFPVVSRRPCRTCGAERCRSRPGPARSAARTCRTHRSAPTVVLGVSGDGTEDHSSRHVDTTASGLATRRQSGRVGLREEGRCRGQDGRRGGKTEVDWKTRPDRLDASDDWGTAFFNLRAMGMIL